MCWRAQSQGLWNEALRWVREGLLRFSKDPELLLAKGTLDETLASVHVVPPAARQELEELFARGPTASSPDSFWSYPWGRSEAAPELLESLRAKSRP